MRTCLSLLFSLCLFLSSGNAWAGAQGVHIATGTNNIGTSFTTSFPQLALTQTAGFGRNLYIFNGSTTATIAVTFSNSAAVAPSSSTTTNPMQVFVGPSSSQVFQGLGVAKYIWVRSDSGSSISTGDVIIDTY